ncbi:MAG: glycosyltransferase family 2 protein [Candidatus Aenigmatarchaeota archaeon]
MNDPLVSVVIPTYKRHNKLNRAIGSILNQSFNGFEIIIVNDFPEESIENHIKYNSSKIRTINHEVNKGAPGARNSGIKSSRGKYIALLDDDDAWKPDKLEIQVRKFEKLDEKYGMVYTGREVIKGSEVVKRYIPKKSGWIYEKLLTGNFIPSETPLIEKKCFERVGMFDTKLQGCQDWDMWLRISKKYKIAKVSKILAECYKGHNDRIEENHAGMFKGRKRVFEKNKDDFEKNKDALSNYYMKQGLDIAYSKTLGSFNYLLRSLVYYRNIKAIPILTTLALPYNTRRKILDKLREVKN